MYDTSDGTLIALGLVSSVLFTGAIVGLALYQLGLFSDLKTEKHKMKRLGRTLTIIIGFAMIILGTAKIFQFGVFLQLWGDYFKALHLMSYVGFVELTLGSLLLFPKSYRLGFLFLNLFLWWLLAMHLPVSSGGLSVTSGAIILLTLAWLSIALYRPELFDDYEDDSDHVISTNTTVQLEGDVQFMVIKKPHFVSLFYHPVGVQNHPKFHFKQPSFQCKPCLIFTNIEKRGDVLSGCEKAFYCHSLSLNSTYKLLT